MANDALTIRAIFKFSNNNDKSNVLKWSRLKQGLLDRWLEPNQGSGGEWAIAAWQQRCTPESCTINNSISFHYNIKPNLSSCDPWILTTPFVSFPAMSCLQLLYALLMLWKPTSERSNFNLPFLNSIHSTISSAQVSFFHSLFIHVCC